MLLPGLCATEAPLSPSSAMSSGSSQTPCATVKCGPMHAEPVEMRGLGAAVDPQARHGLHLRLGDMAVQPDIEIAGQRGAAEDEIVRAMMRDRRRDGRADTVAVEPPAMQRVADRVQRRLAGSQAQRRDALAAARAATPRRDRGSPRRSCGRRPSARSPRECRLRHRPSRPRRRRRWSAPAIRKTDRTARCSLSAPSRLRRSAPTDEGRRRCGCRRSTAPRRAAIRGPAVAHPLAEIAVRVGMGIDEAGMDQPPRRRDFASPLGRRNAGRTQFADRVVLDQDVGRLRRPGPDVEHPPAADDRIGHRHSPRSRLFRSTIPG